MYGAALTLVGRNINNRRYIRKRHGRKGSVSKDIAKRRNQDIIPYQASKSKWKFMQFCDFFSVFRLDFSACLQRIQKVQKISEI
jgi:hypothetical protein